MLETHIATKTRKSSELHAYYGTLKVSRKQATYNNKTKYFPSCYTLTTNNTKTRSASLYYKLLKLAAKNQKALQTRW